MSFGDSHRLETAFDDMERDLVSLELSEHNRSQVAQLLTVWASAYLEATCREVMTTYTLRRAEPSVVAYVMSQLDRFRIPKAENMVNLVRAFDKDAARQLEGFCRGQIKESINSIVGNRHLIAHGRTTKISMAEIMRYFQDAKRFADKMRSVLLK